MNDQPNQLTKSAIQSKILHGKRTLILGIANEHSIAYGCARVFRELGADLAVTFLDEKARPYVEPLAKELGASIFLTCDVAQAGQLEAVFRQTVSPGPLKTRAASGLLKDFDVLLTGAIERAPIGELVDIGMWGSLRHS